MRARLLVAIGLMCCGACDGGGPTGDTDSGSAVDAGGAADANVGEDGGIPPGVDGGPPGDDAGPDTIDAGPPGGGCGLAPGANNRTWTLMHDGRTREFAVHVPTGYSVSAPTPVVLDFHGRNSTAAQQVAVSGMRGKADTEGFIAVHPTGIGRTWNGGLCCGEAMSTGVDDVGFVRALLDRLESELCVDASRVYATGLSNGGFFSHRLACDLSDRIAAVAPVAGPNGANPCAPGRAVSVLHFHGTADAIVPYNGFGGALAVRPTMTAWASRNGCGSTSATYFTSGDVTCEEWSGCRDGASVRLCTIDGGGHQWPGGFTIPGLGYNTSDISATDAMWTFFEAHRL